MPTVRILTEADLRRAVPFDLDAVDCVEGAFRALAGGGVVMPPILSMAIAEFNGEVDVKTAYVPGLDSFALKVSPGFFDNPKIGLPSTSGLMILFSARTGQLEALLLDNGYLTDVRTAAAGAVAARHVAQSLATELTQDLGIEVLAHAEAQAAIAGSDVIVTTTPATEPILMADWLEPGQHITAMGSDQHHKGELEPACLTRADLYVPDRLSQTRTMGELRSAIAAGLIPAETEFAELGAVVAGIAPGRLTADQITIADLTGTGVQDTAIATHARLRASRAGQGTNLDS